MDVSSRGRGASAYRSLLFVATLVAIAAFAAIRFEVPAAKPYNVPLLLGAAGFLVLTSVLYLLAPVFSREEAARARAAYGTTRDVLANGVAGVAIGNLVFLPLLLVALALGEAWQGGWELKEGLEPFIAAVNQTLRNNTPLLVFISLVGLDVALLLVVYLRLLRTGATTERELGWVGSHFLRNFALGLGGFVVVILVSAVIAIALNSFGVTQTQAQELGVRRSTTPVFYLLLVGAGVLAPIAEETFFRGYVFRAYLTALGPVWAFALSALIFGLLHLNLAALLPLIVIGLVLAYLFYRTGSLVPSIVAHGLNNVLALTAVYYSQQGG